MTVRPAVVSKVRGGNTIVTCEACSRILFWQSEEEAEQEGADADE